MNAETFIRVDSRSFAVVLLFGFGSSGLRNLPMNRKRLHNFAREQLQKVNPIIVRSLIRLRSRDLALHASERPTIVFSPHQDDEVLGCGGMIINKRRLGAKIYIVFMTDGRASHKSQFITPTELAELRTMEARECAKAMDVPEENLIFLEKDEQAHAESKCRSSGI